MSNLKTFLYVSYLLFEHFKTYLCESKVNFSSNLDINFQPSQNGKLPTSGFTFSFLVKLLTGVYRSVKIPIPKMSKFKNRTIMRGLAPRIWNLRLEILPGYIRWIKRAGSILPWVAWLDGTTECKYNMEQATFRLGVKFF